MSFDDPNNQTSPIEQISEVGEGTTAQPNFDEYILPGMPTAGAGDRSVATANTATPPEQLTTDGPTAQYQRYGQYGDAAAAAARPPAGSDMYAQQGGDNYGNHGETRNERPENGPQIIIGTRQEFRDAGIPASRANYSISARGDIVEQKPPKTEDGRPTGKYKADQPIYIMLDAGGDNNVRPAQQDALRNLQGRITQQVQRDYAPAREEGGMNIQRLQRRARADAGTDQPTGMG